MKCVAMRDDDMQVGDFFILDVGANLAKFAYQVGDELWK